MSDEESCSSQLIDGDGGFNVTGIDSFIKEVKLADCGLSYVVVSIMGPQSSGKSTLMNHLFGTNFREMDAFKGRCAGIEPCTLVMDLEGTDGRERGEDDTAFEKQSALFALAVLDIVLINMWCHDIGREQAANKPLLKTVFQVMMRLFSPRKTTLMFVKRDKTRTPLENLEPVLREDIQKIWDSVPKPQAHIETPLSEFFNVEVVALSSYEEKEEQFKEQVANLRQRFFHSIAPGGLAGDRRGVVPTSGFSFSAQQIWKVIKENKDLDLPAHKVILLISSWYSLYMWLVLICYFLCICLQVMVVTVRCEEIASEKLFSFSGNEDWRELEEAVQSGPISGFGKKLSSVLGTCLSEYDTEATYFDEGVRSAKRKQLEEKLLQLVQPAFQDLLGHLRSGTLDKFKEAFDKALDSGEGFAAAARECTQSYMALFDDEEEELKELKGFFYRAETRGRAQGTKRHSLLQNILLRDTCFCNTFSVLPIIYYKGRDVKLGKRLNSLNPFVKLVVYQSGIRLWQLNWQLWNSTILGLLLLYLPGNMPLDANGIMVFFSIILMLRDHNKTLWLKGSISICSMLLEHFYSNQNIDRWQMLAVKLLGCYLSKSLDKTILGKIFQNMCFKYAYYFHVYCTQFLKTIFHSYCSEVVLTGLQCKYPIYLALSKATVPVLTYSNVRKYRIKGSTKLSVNPIPLSYSLLIN
ncbi:hypothetical protein UlMin_024772 [Ulmus minor]